MRARATVRSLRAQLHDAESACSSPEAERRLLTDALATERRLSSSARDGERSASAAAAALRAELPHAEQLALDGMPPRSPHSPHSPRGAPSSAEQQQEEEAVAVARSVVAEEALTSVVCTLRAVRCAR